MFVSKSKKDRIFEAKQLTALLPEHNRKNGQQILYSQRGFIWYLHKYKLIELGFSLAIAKTAIESTAWLYENDTL